MAYLAKGGSLSPRLDHGCAWPKPDTWNMPEDVPPKEEAGGVLRGSFRQRAQHKSTNEVPGLCLAFPVFMLHLLPL